MLAVGFAANRFAQVQQVNASCTWKVRAAQWEQTILAWQSPFASQVIIA